MNLKRLQFDFDEEAVEGLDELRARCGAASRAEVVRRALKLLDFLTTLQAEGGELTVKTSQGQEYRPLFF